LNLKIIEFTILSIIFATLKIKIMTKFDRSKISNFMSWFGLTMIATYIGLGIFVLYTDSLSYLGQNVRFVFSFFFFAFAIFRGVNWLQKRKAMKYSEDTEYQDI
jgi:hypothetical protein